MFEVLIDEIGFIYKKRLKTPRGNHNPQIEDRQHGTQRKKDKRRNKELQSTMQKTKDRATRIQPNRT
jgi:hypothetical protein